jgi:hypothetical protein
LYGAFNILLSMYTEEAQQRWPDQYKESQQRLDKLSKEEQQALFNQGDQNYVEIAELFKAGLSPEHDDVQAVIAKHYEWVSAFWTPNKVAYIGLGEMYVSDERFTAYYDKIEPGLAVFMQNSMKIWATNNLA